MRKLIVLAVVLAIVVSALSAGPALAGPGGKGGAKSAKHDASCTISPNPATVNEVYTISAAGLPTVDPVWLIATPPSGYGTVSEVTVNPDGTASVATSGSTAGTWTYVFSGLQTNNKYGAVATCSVLAN